MCVPRRAAGVFSGYSSDSSFSDLVKSGESTLLSNTCTNQCPAPPSSAPKLCNALYERGRQALHRLHSHMERHATRVVR